MDCSAKSANTADTSPAWIFRSRRSLGSATSAEYRKECLIVTTDNSKSFPVYADDWERIREHFTQTEKDLLVGAMVGQSVCPQIAFIDLDQAGNTGVKLKRLIDDLPKNRQRILR